MTYNVHTTYGHYCYIFNNGQMTQLFGLYSRGWKAEYIHTTEKYYYHDNRPTSIKFNSYDDALLFVLLYIL